MFYIEQGDITTYAVDAIVNAANTRLAGGGGVDGAIHRVAGPDLMRECRAIGGVQTGQAVITGGYALPAKHVIHVAGPIWHGGSQHEETLLHSCYTNALRICGEKGLQSVAFSSISTGVYGYPLHLAVPVALQAISEGMRRWPQIRRAVMVCFDQNTLGAYQAAWEKMDNSTVSTVSGCFQR